MKKHIGSEVGGASQADNNRLKAHGVRLEVDDCGMRIADLKARSRSDGFRLGGVHPTTKHYH
jgi:hypothetical protein